MEEIDITQDKSGKVLKKILTPGDPAKGTPWKGDEVTVHYTGTLHSDGSKFDSSRDRGDQFKFKVGVGQVIKGWDIGIMSMYIGEKSVFTIQSDFGYGDMGSPPKIPPGATLVFEVELFNYEGEDVTESEDKCVIKRIKSVGDDNESPKDETIVDISFTARVEGSKEPFDQRDNVKFSLGFGFENNIPIGLEIAIKKMVPKEEAQVTMKTLKYATQVYKSFDSVPTNSVLVYDITLNSMEHSKERWQCTPEENFETAKCIKVKGTEYFKKTQFDIACKLYIKALGYISDSPELKDDGNTELEELSKSLELNIIMCYLKMKEWLEAKNRCDTFISSNKDSAKAFFRRGEALMGLSDPALAKKDFKMVVELEPENKAGKNRLIEATNKVNEQKKKEAALYANMFEKFAADDVRREVEAQKKVKPVEIEDWK
ncbi:peptidyl-prolyl cis-trans isomerase FKBP4 [Lepeophtheirus salmonis]|uniref:peptidylprolyl isomerase n=1 Tax=Lepeophtheirus salmonis TaxID=72036 RepID=C1BVQ1_LEPSM|nr:peptidyl-prolyl cis-trans isomerase FKBP4-like [Lepeophtheirus salmonis]ACO13104.1 FK506-binding protein 4 [Lepeophtheirus salmonis]